MGQAAADLGAARIRELLKERESVNIILGSAPSQLELYAALLTSGLDFGRIHAFHMDVGKRPAQTVSNGCEYGF